MDESQVLSFIQYYQRLTVHTLAVMDKTADCIFVLDNQRNIVQGTLHAKAINE
jgi:D-glycerate 3-kinase